MKITDVRTIPVDRYLFVQVETDEGITGLGESGAWGYLEASEKAVETFRRYLVGQDPLRIEHHWQALYRWTHFRGAAIMGALSAIDIALWDIAGKHFGVPAYQLLGGKCRDKARVYYHVFGSTTEQLVQGCVDAKKQGFTAVGHLTPFLDESRDLPYFKTHAEKMRDAIDTVGRYRDAVGNEVDLCIEIHRRLTPTEAVVLARGQELERLPHALAPWGAWKDRHPDTVLLARDEAMRKRRKRNPYGSYFGSDQLRFPVQPFPPEAGPELKERVTVLMLDGEHLVLPHGPVAQAVDEHGSLELVLGSAAVQLEYHASTDTLWVGSDQRSLRHAAAFWFAWYATHPHDRVWDPPRPEGG